MKLKSILRVFHQEDVKERTGVMQGMGTKRLVGCKDQPTERISLTLATVSPGTSSPFHWHLEEKCYYVISGRGVIRDIEGNEHEIRPGSVIFAPPGIEGTHEFEAHEQMQLIAISATQDLEKTLQFSVDKKTFTSSIELDLLVKRLGGTAFRSFF